MKILLASLLLAVSIPMGLVRAQTQKNLPKRSMTISGVMRHTNVEGGCWYLEAEGGKHYELFGDTAILNPLRVEGQTATLIVSPMRGAASICMVGEIVTVIERVDVHRFPYDPNVTPITLDGTVHRTKRGTWYLKTKDARYEFQNPPPAKYRHVNARYRERMRVLLDRGSTKENMNGVIETEKKLTSRNKGAKQKPEPDSR